MWSSFVFKNVQHNKRSFAEITCCKIDFLRHKFSVIQSISTLGELAPICKYNESIVELKTKMKDLGKIDCSCILCR